MGGTIRLVLYLLSQLPSLLPALSTFLRKKWLTLPFPWRSATVCAMRSETTAIISNWSWNSSTLSFIDFISEKLGPVYYNAGIEEAIRTHLAWSERIQEEMDLKKIL